MQTNVSRQIRTKNCGDCVQVDVLVNTTGKDLVLSHGAVSQSILSAAGQQIQAECKKNVQTQNFKYGDIVETKGYQLPVTSVYHGACSNWDSGAGPCEQVSLIDHCPQWNCYRTFDFIVIVINVIVVYNEKLNNVISDVTGMSLNIV